MKSVNISRILVILFSLVAIGLFFLPMTSMTKEAREDFSETFKGFEDYKILGEEVDMEAKDFVDLSMYDFARFLIQTENRHSDGIFFYVFGGMAAACFIFGLIKIPTLVILADGAMYFLYRIIMDSLNPNLFNGSANRVGGISYHLYYPIIILIGVSAIALFVTKHLYKKSLKQK